METLDISILLVGVGYMTYRIGFYFGTYGAAIEILGKEIEEHYKEN